MLQRIGICYAAVALLARYTEERAQWAVFGALLVGYWTLFVAGGSLEPFANLADRVDTAILGPSVYQFDAATGRGHDPEGMLSTLFVGLRWLIARTLQWRGVWLRI